MKCETKKGGRPAGEGGSREVATIKEGTKK